MKRQSADGRSSLIDLIAVYTQKTKKNAHSRLKRLTDKGVVSCHDSVILGDNRPTPFVTEEQWVNVKSHLMDPDDLYIMQYSTADKAVKIGRSHDVENVVAA